MPPLLMVGYDRNFLPPRTIREAARGHADPLSPLVASGRVKGWDLLGMLASDIPGARDWADKTLDEAFRTPATKATETLTASCTECADIGFYGLPSREDPDALVALLRRQGDGGYETLTASGDWEAWEPRFDQQLEILSQELATDLAEALTAGASSLVRRYFWPQAFLPPTTMIAATSAPELAEAPADTEQVTAGPDDGWVEYALVDDLDPGAVLELIRLRRGPTGPELVAYRNGIWAEAPEVLSDLQGVQPPPLVQLDQAQLDAVLSQVNGPEAEAAPAPSGEPEAQAEGETVAAAAAPLAADAALTVSPDPRAEKLRRYWTTGKGAAKIRWGTPGDWTRCYRQLRKHMGMRAKGYCQNLHKRATGIWAGDRKNAGRGAAALAAAGVGPVALSMEAALVAAVSTGRWTAPEGVNGMLLKDGIYTEGGNDVSLLKTLTAGGFPVDPPDDWFADPLLASPTPLTVDDDGRVYGHIATFDVAHIGLPGKVRAPRSRSGYAYFKTGELRTASGKRVNVGQLTLAGGHASLQADAAAAVAHYDNTASAVADVNIGEDRYGIWVAGSIRPEVTPTQLRTLRASAPSGDWRPINGHLELVACCQVNVPGFPTVRARVASGAITSLVAAGSAPLYARRLALMADASMAERLDAMEAVVFDALTEAPIVADGEGAAGAEAPAAEGSVTEGTPAAEGAPEGETEGEKPVSDAVKRAREAAAARRAAKAAEAPAEPAAEEQPAPGQTPGEEPPAEIQVAEDPQPDLVAQDDADTAQAAQVHDLQVERHATAADARMAELRMRVHGNRKPVAASGA